MKVWASASAIGLLSMAYFATACSSEPPTDPGYMPPAGGSPGTGGSASPTSGATGNPTGGNPAGTSGSAGSSPTTGGSAGSAPVGGTGGSTTGGTGTGGSGGTGVGAGTCPQGVLGHCDAGANYPTYPGYTLALVEDFSTPINLDTDPIWTWSDGSPADGQTGFRKEQIAFADGFMTITAESPCAPKTTNSGCIAPRTSHAEALVGNTTANVAAMGVWSGELRTKYNNYRYGRYEVKMRAPNANPGQEASKTLSGDFLATMFIFRNPKNAVWNEIDIELEPNHFDELAGNVISVAGRTGYPGDVAGAFVTAANPVPNFTIYQDHVYAFTWEADKVEWFIDGTSVHVETNTTKVPKLSAKIMMNLWVFSGGAFGDGVNNKFPFHSTYDWFRFYKSANETKYPCADVACLDPADKTTSAQNNPTETNYGQ